MATILEAAEPIDAEGSRAPSAKSISTSGIGPRWLTDPLRRFQRCVNPLVLTFAGRHGPYGVVRHVGRRSGRQYTTPVAVRMLGDDFIVPLPYSTATDWWRNLAAAGGLIVLDDLMSEVSRPPEWRGQPDPTRSLWLNDPRLAAVELIVEPSLGRSSAVIVATHVGASAPSS